MSDSQFDLVVIGGGPGDYVAAIRSAQLGMKTAVVEREHMGGICLNWGCIPTKALLRTAEVYHLMQNARDFGLSAENITFDLAKIVKRSRAISRRLSNGVGYLMKKNKITVVEGEAKLAGAGQIHVLDKEGNSLSSLSASNIILATGARARQLPGLEADGNQVWTYKEAMIPDAMPASMLVVGSGAIGIEFASFYNTLGVDVTVVEVMDRVLPVEDEEISEIARKSFLKQGMKIETGTVVEKLDRGGELVTAHLKKPDGSVETLQVEKVIMAVGITGNIENIGLESLGVETDRGHIMTDPYGRTNIEGVYAIGDVAGAPWLAHKASHEGILCVENIAGVEGLHPMETKNIPGCTYCTPQVASVGLTEKAAIEAGHEVRVGRFPYQGNGKAIALGDTEGLIKTVFDAKTGELLGAHLVGAEVTELIQGYTIAKTMETTEQELMHTVFPHPTLSEMMHESVLDAYDKVLHI